MCHYKLLLVRGLLAPPRPGPVDMMYSFLNPEPGTEIGNRRPARRDGSIIIDDDKSPFGQLGIQALESDDRRRIHVAVEPDQGKRAGVELRQRVFKKLLHEDEFVVEQAVTREVRLDLLNGYRQLLKLIEDVASVGG